MLLRLLIEASGSVSSGALVSCLAIALGASRAGRGPGLLATAISLVPDLLSGHGGPAFGRLGLLLVTGVCLSVIVDGVARSARTVKRALAASDHEMRKVRRSEEGLRLRVGRLQGMLAASEGFIRKRHAAWHDDHRRRQEAELLTELTHQLHRLLDVDRMLHPIAAVVRQLVSADFVRIALRGAGGRGFRLRYALGDEQTAERHATIGVDSRFVTAVMSTGHTVHCDLSQEAPDGVRDDLALPADAGGVMIAPIHVGGSIEGLLIAAAAAPGRFGDSHERLLERIVDVSAIAIRNAQLLAGEQGARAAAEASSRAKDEFLAMLGHELRNPLGAIGHAVSGFGRIREQWSQLQEILGRQTGHLARLLDDLLDVSRLTMGRIALDARPLDFARLVDNVLRALDREGRFTGHRLEVSTASVWVSADGARLEQVVRNLVDNAVKYTPAGGRISVEVGADEEHGVLRVRDSGIGIDPDMLPRVFDLFVQERQALDRSRGGLGLGLTVVKRIVELHGGTVSAQSPGEGQGSEFVVRLPSVAAGEGASATERREGVAHLAGRAAVRRCRVAVVEDYADAREALQRLLVLEGHEVTTAGDGLAGLDLIVKGQPDVALVDIGLPGLDGYEVVRRARRTPGGSELYLVALTGYGQPYDRARVLDAGFNEHLVKPVDFDALQTVLSHAGTAAAARDDRARSRLAAS